MRRSTFASFGPTGLTIDSGHEFGYSLDAAVNPGLTVDVVVLDSIEEPRKAPERVGFYGV